MEDQIPVKRNRAGVFLRGMAMGAADVIPGVSGGTVAFITGIYQELISSLGSIDTRALNMALHGKFIEAWRHVNGGFLILLFAGIVSSIASLAHVISWLLDTYPEPLWAYFFGLIIASSIYIATHFKIFHVGNAAILFVAMLLAYLLSNLTAMQVDPTWLMLVASGIIAISAMLLPGISGSFILVLLGMYQVVLGAIKEFQIVTLSLFVIGCIIGLLSFTHIVAWLLKRYYTQTLAALTGFMLGSLSKVWPWKLQGVHGSYISETNVLPGQYLAHTDPRLLMVSVCLCAGLATVYLINRAGRGKP